MGHLVLLLIIYYVNIDTPSRLSFVHSLVPFLFNYALACFLLIGSYNTKLTQICDMLTGTRD
jgi:hypothetical protein